MDVGTVTGLCCCVRCCCCCLHRRRWLDCWRGGGDAGDDVEVRSGRSWWSALLSREGERERTVSEDFRERESTTLNKGDEDLNFVIFSLYCLVLFLKKLPKKTLLCVKIFSSISFFSLSSLIFFSYLFILSSLCFKSSHLLFLFHFLTIL